MRGPNFCGVTIDFSWGEGKRIFAINDAAGFNINLFAGDHEAEACPIDYILSRAWNVRGTGQDNLVTYRKDKVVYQASYVYTAPQKCWLGSICE